jgi:hypothetical protein
MASQFVARIGDQCAGICYLHTPALNFTGTFTTGSSISTADGQAICISNGHTESTLTCGHHGISVTGSTLCTTTDGGGFHRIGDTGRVLEDTSGRSTYVVTTGSSTVQCL